MIGVGSESKFVVTGLELWNTPGIEGLSGGGESAPHKDDDDWYSFIPTADSGVRAREYEQWRESEEGGTFDACFAPSGERVC